MKRTADLLLQEDQSGVSNMPGSNNDRSLLALRECDARAVSPDDLFPFQFTLGEQPFPDRYGWTNKPFGAKTLCHSPKLPVAELTDASGFLIGYCLGIAVDAAGERVHDRVLADLSCENPTFWDMIEDFVIGLGGRYLLVLQDRHDQRIYGDVSSSYSCVYDPLTGQIGSTLLMCLKRDIIENEDVDYQLTISGKQRQPFGHTRDKHAKRLAANHYLSLSDLTEHRFWPRPGELKDIPQSEAEDEIGRIRQRLADVIAAIAKSETAALPLSGGNDSRNLLACAKPVLEDITRFFTQVHNRNSRVDFLSAHGLARTLNIDLQRHGAEEDFSAGEILERTERFSLATGFGAPLPQAYNKNFWAGLGSGQAVMLGNVMEVLRATHWRTGDPGDRKLNRKFGLKRCLFVGGGGFTREFISRWLPQYNEWYSRLPRDGQKKYIDVGFVEHNLPFLGISLFGYFDNFYLCPFNDRQLVARSARLPLGYRYSNQANTELLSQAAPELRAVPFAWEIHSGKRKRAT